MLQVSQFRTIVAGLTLVLCASSQLLAQAEDNPKNAAATSPNDASLDRQLAAYQKLAAIFKAIDPTDVKGKQWAVVETGPVGCSSRMEGWLIEEKPSAIIILTINGCTESIRKPRPGEQRLTVKQGESIPLGEYEKNVAAWKVQSGDFRKFCSPLLKRSVEEQIKDRVPAFEGHEDAYALANRRSASADVVIDAARYAHWAAQVGEKDLAIDLYSLAARAHKQFQEHGWWSGNPDLHVFVANEIASGRCSGAIAGGHYGTPRPDLLKAWESIAKIPYHQRIDEAKQMARDYSSLIAEDKAWKEPDAAALAKMTAEQKVAYWMYHLRDANMEQMSDPGMCSVLGGFLSSRGDEKEPNPAVELERLGLAAIPELIAHLDDTRPTRCQADGRRFAPDSYYLLRYGDCCQQIFEGITGHSIYKREDTNGYPLKDGKGAQCKAEAERWWRDYQRKGEKQILIEGTEAGDRDSPTHAERLIAKYPDAALQAIAKGVRKSHDAWVRESLLDATDALKDERVLPLLREEIAGPYRLSRVAACWGLARRRHEEGLQAMLKEWRRPVDKGDDRVDEQRAVENLIRGLVYTGEPAAIQALAADFRGEAVNVRSEIVEIAGDPDRNSHLPPRPPETQTAIDELLASAIDDKEQTSSVRGGLDGKEIRNPSIGDLAAEVLSARLGQPHLFNIYGHWGDRARQRLIVKNAWLKKCGRRTIRVPDRRAIVLAAADRVQPLLDSVQSASAPSARRASLTALQNLGLPALPAICQALKALKPDHIAYPELQSLAQRTALTVAEVRFDDDSVKPSDELRDGAAALRDKPITQVALMNFLRWSIRRLPSGVRGIKLTLERAGDDSGAELTISLVADKPPTKGLSPQLTISHEILLDRETISAAESGIAGIGRIVRLEEIDWDNLPKNLGKGLQARPEQYLLIQVGCEEMR